MNKNDFKLISIILVSIIVLSIVEASTANLVCIWYIVSAILTLIVSLFIDNTLIEFAIFVLLGTILLLATKNFIKNKLISKEKTNLDRIIGMRGVVTEDIEDLVIGEVLVDGKKWSAISDSSIKKGEKVKIVKIEGVKLVVER